MTTIQPIVFDDGQDNNYEKLYKYFISCEVSGEAVKVKRIMEILGRSETTVYGRIRSHWNEFISRNDVQGGRSEYVVKGLRNTCPLHFFVLAHRRAHAKYFFLFQTAILKYENHIQRLQERKNLEEFGTIDMFLDQPDDGIPPIIDDEGNELPEDTYPQTFDEEDEEVDVENEGDEKTEEDSKVPELIQLVYTSEPKPASVYVQPPPSEQEVEFSEKPTLVNHVQGVQDLENKHPDSSSSAPTKSLFRQLLGIALILIIVAVILKIFFSTIK